MLPNKGLAVGLAFPENGFSTGSYSIVPKAFHPPNSSKRG